MTNSLLILISQAANAAAAGAAAMIVYDVVDERPIIMNRLASEPDVPIVALFVIKVSLCVWGCFAPPLRASFPMLSHVYIFRIVYIS